MARIPADRLSRGFAREELRKLRRAVGDTHPQGASIIRLVDMVRDRTSPRFAKDKRLTDEQCSRLKRDINAFVDDNFMPLQRFSTKQTISGLSGIWDVQSFFYSQVAPHHLQSADEGREDFTEEAMEFRFGRYVIDKRRFVMDDFSCNVTFSDHTLMRLVQRNACEKEPIAFLGRQMNDILPYVPVYLASAIMSSCSFGLMIPMPDGILMGVYTVNRQPEAIGMHFRRRVMSCKEGSGMIPSPVANIFPEDGNTDSMVSIRISTYVSLDMMTEDQKWCRAALMAMSRQNESIHGDLVGLITKPEVGLDVDVIGPAFTDFKLIVESDFWKRANWRENSS